MSKKRIVNYLCGFSGHGIEIFVDFSVELNVSKIPGQPLPKNIKINIKVRIKFKTNILYTYEQAFIVVEMQTTKICISFNLTLDKDKI